MDLRENKSRLILIVVTLGAALVIAVASCSGGGGEDDGGSGGSASGQESNGESEDPTEDPAGGDDEEEEEPAAEILAEVTGEQDIVLAITRAEREAGGFLTVEGTIHNAGDDEWRATAWAGDENELADNGFSMAGATLVAHEEGRRFLILRDTEGRCLCTNFGLRIDPGDTINWYAQFPEPEPETTEVDFQIGQMPPATIEIR
ncbi:hypothetical protein [Streptomyces litchfieldiae]|uniref:Secreted protein n=1 Tax=Streptomyces litchfieldiae TaxID=3075543 RepID=A0ABU2MLM5_9ACTN|nr:hypothetical protein [Streptomyces sp. DSM 44938]MDT0342376.1 hypothetical protein [Streptomyces sp. DSM 44938]